MSLAARRNKNQLNQLTLECVETNLNVPNNSLTVMSRLVVSASIAQSDLNVGLQYTVTVVAQRLRSADLDISDPR